MAKYGPRAAPANMFELTDEEAYAGCSKQDWGKIFQHLEVFKSVKLEDFEPENRDCDLGRHSLYG